MIKQLLEKIFYGAVVSLPIILAGVLISYFIVGDKSKLEFVLFALGAIPIVLFFPGLLTQSKSGALHTPKVIYRKVETNEVKKSEEANITNGTSQKLSPLVFVLAGLITWFIGGLI